MEDERGQSPSRDRVLLCFAGWYTSCLKPSSRCASDTVTAQSLSEFSLVCNENSVSSVHSSHSPSWGRPLLCSMVEGCSWHSLPLRLVYVDDSCSWAIIGAGRYWLVPMLLSRYCVKGSRSDGGFVCLVWFTVTSAGLHPGQTAGLAYLDPFTVSLLVSPYNKINNCGQFTVEHSAYVFGDKTLKFD